MDPRERLAAERYLLLVEQLRDLYVSQHDGKEHGWIRWAAKKLRVRPEHVRLILDGDRQAGGKLVGRAVLHYVRDPDFFYNPALKKPDHRDYLQLKSEPTTVREPPDPADGGADEADDRALWDFLAGGIRAPVTNGEVDQLRTWSKRSHRKGALTVADYAEALDLIRGAKPPPATPPAPAGPDDPRSVGKRRAEASGGMQVRKRK